MGSRQDRMLRASARTLLVVLGVASCVPDDWPMHRYNRFRTASQPKAGPLSDPTRVTGLHELWTWHPAAVGDPDLVTLPGWGPKGFSASPIVYGGQIFVGHLNGRMLRNRRRGDDALEVSAWRQPFPDLDNIV